MMQMQAGGNLCCYHRPKQPFGIMATSTPPIQKPRRVVSSSRTRWSSDATLLRPQTLAWSKAKDESLSRRPSSSGSINIGIHERTLEHTSTSTSNKASASSPRRVSTKPDNPSNVEPSSSPKSLSEENKQLRAELELFKKVHSLNSCYTI